ncbi:hypothetical protein pb186bvf_015704 [Paramecium bursaria]
MNNIQSFDYPDEDQSFQEDSQDEEQNPFLFELEYYASEMDRIEALFNRKQQDKVLAVVKDVKYNLNKLRKYALQIQKEHKLFGVIKKAYEDLKSKTINHDAFITSMMNGYDKQIQEVQQELIEQQRLSREMKNELENKIKAQKQQIEEKQALLFMKDQELKHVKASEENLKQQVMTLSQELQRIQKEIILVKKIRTQNYLQLTDISQQKSSLELLLGTKIKNFIVNYLTPKDLANIILTSKNLYISLCQFRIIVPQLLRCTNLVLTNQIKLLTKQIETFRRLLNDCTEPEIKGQIIKVYEMQNNPTDQLDNVLIESSQLIKGNQFLGLQNSLDKEDSNQGLLSYLEAMKQRSSFVADVLKQQSYNLSQFTQYIQMQSEEKSSFIVERTKNIKKLQQNVQEIMGRIFEIGTVASANPGLYSSFMAMLQKQFSQLYIYSTNVSQECKLMQSLCYYMVVQHWQLIEKLRVLEQLNQDKQNRLQANQQDFKQNNERIKQLENVIKQQQQIINVHDQVVKKEVDEKEDIKQDLFETKQLLLNYGKNIKLLAIEIRALREQNKKIVQSHNSTVLQINELRQQLNQVYS